MDENRTSAKIALVQIEGGREVVREVNHYSLDVILAVGYRVNSKKATQFRQWANQIHRAYIEQGYVINEAALRESPEKLNKLAAEIRALRAEELYRLHLLSEQFLLYAESTALAKKKMTMKSLHEQLDRLLRLNDYPVFEGYQDYLKDRAIAHAEREYALLKKRIYIQSQGIEYDEDLYQAGEYDEILADYTE